MTEPEGFLTRWTRRKRDAARQASEPAEHERTTDPVETAAPDADGADALSKDDVAHAETSHVDVEGEKEPAFDLSKLPSIESITAETDIRPFLARGVPADLRQAALRRVWVVDPHIRDFIGIAENQGDFTGAGTMPGFDFSPPTGDVAKMVAEMFGDRSQDESPRGVGDDGAVAGLERPLMANASDDHRNVSPDRPIDEIGNSEPFVREAAPDSSVRRSVIARETDTDVAMQNNAAPPEEKITIARRSHGGAMPK